MLLEKWTVLNASGKLSAPLGPAALALEQLHCGVSRDLGWTPPPTRNDSKERSGRVIV